MAYFLSSNSTVFRSNFIYFRPNSTYFEEKIVILYEKYIFYQNPRKKSKIQNYQNKVFKKMLNQIPHFFSRKQNLIQNNF